MSKNTKMNASALEAQRKEKRNAKIITACIIVVAILIVGLAVYSLVGDSGILLGATVAETENFEVDAAMMSYMYSANQMNYYQYLSMLGVDMSKSLKTQDCPFMGEEGGTWFDYFVTLTKNQINELLPVCEAAKAAGVSLTAEDQASIDAALDSMKAEAVEYGYSNINGYLKAMTGNSIKIDDVRHCLELSTLAGKYTTEFINGLSYTADELTAYVDEHAEEFLGIDLYSYSFNTSDYSFADDSEAKTLMDIAKKDAEALAQNKNLKDFTAALKAIIDEKTTKNTDETDEEFEQRKADLLDSYLQKHVVKVSLNEKVAKWAFEADLYDTYVDSESNATKCTVYMLAKDEYIDESKSRDVRHILFMNDNHKDDTKAQEAFAKLEAEGFTVDAFTAIAAEYSEDTNSKDNGGLYENVFEGEMVAEFDAWLFDADRKVGDCEVIKAKDTGWHIIYYAGEGDQLLWEANAEAGLKEAAYSALIEQYGANLKYNEKAINRIEA